MSKRPVVCIPANRVEFENASGHAIKHQYVRPLTDVVDAVPLIIPAIGPEFNLREIADRIDGILLTGSPSHVNPEIYGAPREFEDSFLDLNRDATDIPLIKEAIALDIPLFGICRGFQELNVACGGTLHQFVHNLPGKFDHRAPQDVPPAERYHVQKHSVRTNKGGLFERWGLPETFTCNSLHNQGVDKLGAGLFVEGVCAEDGVIEAVSMPGKRFIFGTQFHPEGDFFMNPVSKRLFEEFARALRK